MGPTNGKVDTLAKCRGDQIFDLQEYKGNTVPIPGGQRFSRFILLLTSDSILQVLRDTPLHAMRI